MIRRRNFEKFENIKLYDDKLPDEIKVNFKELLEYFKKFSKKGFEVVVDTKKSDWIYQKDGIWHQLQEVKDIGLIDYVYKKFNTEKTEDEMFDFVFQHLKDLEIEVEYNLGIDKLRSLISGELKFSKNQIGLYEWQ